MENEHTSSSNSVAQFPARFMEESIWFRIVSYLCYKDAYAVIHTCRTFYEYRKGEWKQMIERLRKIYIVKMLLWDDPYVEVTTASEAEWKNSWWPKVLNWKKRIVRYDSRRVLPNPPASAYNPGPSIKAFPFNHKIMAEVFYELYKFMCALPCELDPYIGTVKPLEKLSQFLEKPNTYHYYSDSEGEYRKKGSLRMLFVSVCLIPVFLKAGLGEDTRIKRLALFHKITLAKNQEKWDYVWNRKNSAVATTWVDWPDPLTDVTSKRFRLHNLLVDLLTCENTPKFKTIMTEYKNLWAEHIDQDSDYHFDLINQAMMLRNYEALDFLLELFGTRNGVWKLKRNWILYTKHDGDMIRWYADHSVKFLENGEDLYEHAWHKIAASYWELISKVQWTAPFVQRMNKPKHPSTFLPAICEELERLQKDFPSDGINSVFEQVPHVANQVILLGKIGEDLYFKQVMAPMSNLFYVLYHDCLPMFLLLTTYAFCEFGRYHSYTFCYFLLAKVLVPKGRGQRIFRHITSSDRILANIAQEIREYEKDRRNYGFMSHQAVVLRYNYPRQDEWLMKNIGAQLQPLENCPSSPSSSDDDDEESTTGERPSKRMKK